MIKFKNNTPFETSISIYGSNRLLYSELSCTKELTSAPSFVHWFTEWIKILYNGPTYKSIMPQVAGCGFGLALDGHALNHRER